MQKYATVNKGFTFLLTVIDIVSKQAWAISLKNKQGYTLKNSLQNLFNNGRIPTNLHVDKGSEFYNKDIKSLLVKHKVHL
jgi:hypothetical protein